jgi:hypothetical protein
VMVGLLLRFWCRRGVRRLRVFSGRVGNGGREHDAISATSGQSGIMTRGKYCGARKPNLPVTKSVDLVLVSQAALRRDAQPRRQLAERSSNVELNSPPVRLGQTHLQYQASFGYPATLLWIRAMIPTAVTFNHLIAMRANCDA